MFFAGLFAVLGLALTCVGAYGYSVSGGDVIPLALALVGAVIATLAVLGLVLVALGKLAPERHPTEGDRPQH